MADEDRDELLDVARDIADGLTIDWRRLDSDAATPEARERLRSLELLAGIGRLHAPLGPDAAPQKALHDSILHPTPSAGAVADPTPIVTWGPLTVIEKIGSGTFGDVYRARETRLDRDVALKLLRHFDVGAVEGAEVIEEARLMAKVRHPNVTTIYGADRIGDRVGLWMELIDGRTLEEELAEHATLAAAEVRRVGAEIAAALTAVHRAGLLHRDVKAHNVMRARDGRLMLTDFGTGRPLETDTAANSERLAGSPLYVAPEVLEGAPTTVRSDLYSLGVLLFHLATGSFPVRGRTLQDLRSTHAAGGRDRLRRARPGWPADVTEAVDRLLATNPADCPETADDLVRLLSPRRASGRVPTLTAVAVVTMAAVGVGVWATVRAVYGPGPPAASEDLVLTGAAASGVLAVSPDGAFVAYSDRETGNLGVHELSSGRRRLLTASASWDRNEFAETAVFSSDGLRLAYSWASIAGDSMRISVRVIDRERPVEAAPIFVHDPDEWMGVYDWSRDGRHLAAQLNRRGLTDIALLSPTGGAPVMLRTLDWRGSTRLSFSPDTRYLAYDHPTGVNTARRDVSLTRLDTLESYPVVTGPGREHIVGWSQGSRGGEHVLVTSDRRATIGLWAQRLEDGRPRGEPTLVRSGVRDDPVGVSADRRMFFRSTSHDQTIVTLPIDLDTGARTQPPASPIASGLFTQRRPKWSPNGEWFSYLSTVPSQRQGQMTLSIQSTATDQVRILPLKLGGMWTYSWAPDGRSFLTRGFDFENRHGVFRIDAETGEVVPLLVSVVPPVFLQPHWARDGRRFFYTKAPTPAGSRDDVVIERDVESGAEQVILRNRDLRTPEGDAAPVIRDWVVAPDGVHAAGLEAAENHHAVWVVALGTPVVRQVYRVEGGPNVGVPITHNALLWTPDSRALIVNAGVSTEGRSRRDLWVVPIQTGQAATKIDIGTVVLRNDAPAVSPDGRQVAFQVGEDAEPELRAVRFAPP